ncbi:phage tail terminator-like protein [Brucella anthropi]|uniref:phage tail terminator-like protein n=1 Tax=Brucella anthropi TaxID=529 RepID=UPI003D96F5C6
MLRGGSLLGGKTGSVPRANQHGGATKSTENAGKVAEHFPTDLKLPKDGLSVRITKAPDIAQGFSDETHWQVPLTISYDCFA